MNTYKGSCHCGNVQYEVEMNIDKPIECNCSICGRLGTVLSFVSPEQFNLMQGEDSMKDYLFNKEVIHHLFCTNCGVHAYGWGHDNEGNKMISINLRCLEGVDIKKLETQFFDGKSM